MTDPNPPSPKVTWPALVGAALTIVVTVASSLGYDMPPGLQGALYTIGLAAVGWFVTDPLRQPPQ